MCRKYLSNDSVLLDVRRMTLAEGRGKGTELFRITNSAGLDFDVIIDRCMAIGALRVDGQLISYTSETGIVHPAYYDKEDFGWLRSFGGGFLATCGLLQVGEPCSGHGLHGRIDNIPAEQVSWRRWWENDTMWAELSGVMYEVSHQGEHLSLHRTIRVCHNQKKLWITDKVQNHGATPQPFMLLYHVNMGAPFLRPGTKVTLPDNELQYFDKVAETHIPYCETVPDISAEPLDLLWLHHTTQAGTQRVCVDNGEQKLTMVYSGDTLPTLGQWELLFPRAYVLALEPTNTHLQGQAWEQANQSLRYIAPDAVVDTQLEFTFE